MTPIAKAEPVPSPKRMSSDKRGSTLKSFQHHSMAGLGGLVREEKK